MDESLFPLLNKTPWDLLWNTHEQPSFIWFMHNAEFFSLQYNTWVSFFFFLCTFSWKRFLFWSLEGNIFNLPLDRSKSQTSPSNSNKVIIGRRNVLSKHHFAYYHHTLTFYLSHRRLKLSVRVSVVRSSSSCKTSQSRWYITVFISPSYFLVKPATCGAQFSSKLPTLHPKY